MPKYSVPDDHWQNDEEPDRGDSPAKLDTIEVNVILTTDPHADMGYGREKYTAHVVHDDTDGLYVLHVVEHRWKGNFWRDIRDWDWKDAPGLVRERVASVVDCDGVDDLDPGVRLVDEGGESTWSGSDE